MAKHSWGNAGNADFVGKHDGRARPARCKVRRHPPARAVEVPFDTLSVSEQDLKDIGIL
jgi:hypothetical protein